MDSQQSYLFGVILAGGSGSRLWPLSRELYPKHFLNLLGSQSLLQSTVARMERLVPPQNTILVTNQKNLTDIKTHLEFFERLEKKKEKLEQLILEPIGRNTAPAIALAAFHLYSKNPESVMIVMPSDHLIKDEEKFLNLIKYSLRIAIKGYLVTFGIVPDYPETGYGYIRKGLLIDKKEPEGQETYLADSFFEKPSQNVADQYLESGSYLWNSGVFVWKTKEILRAIKIYLPELFQILDKFYNLICKDSCPVEELEKIYNQIVPISIDKGVLEKHDRIVVIPAQIGWSDVGSWDKIHQILPKDKNGNFIDKKVIQIDCENSLLYGDKRIIAAIGLKDIIVVDTEDAVLICRKDNSQKVKDIFENMKQNGISEYLQSRTVTRPWGQWSMLLKSPGYKIKKILISPAKSLSLQMHKYRSEHWVVVSGQAQVTMNNKTFFLEKNQSAFIPPGCIHRLANDGKCDLEIIEVQNGDYLEEDDIVRLEDKYGRA